MSNLTELYSFKLETTHHKNSQGLPYVKIGKTDYYKDEPLQLNVAGNSSSPNVSVLTHFSHHKDDANPNLDIFFFTVKRYNRNAKRVFCFESESYKIKIDFSKRYINAVQTIRKGKERKVFSGEQVFKQLWSWLNSAKDNLDLGCRFTFISKIKVYCSPSNDVIEHFSFYKHIPFWCKFRKFFSDNYVRSAISPSVIDYYYKRNRVNDLICKIFNDPKCSYITKLQYEELVSYIIDENKYHFLQQYVGVVKEYGIYIFNKYFKDINVHILYGILNEGEKIRVEHFESLDADYINSNFEWSYYPYIKQALNHSHMVGSFNSVIKIAAFYQQFHKMLNDNLVLVEENEQLEDFMRTISMYKELDNL